MRAVVAIVLAAASFVLAAAARGYLPGAIWTVMPVFVLAALVAVGVCHLLAGRATVSLRADPPQGLQGSSMLLLASYRLPLPGEVSVVFDAFGRTLTGRADDASGVISGDFARIPRGEHWIKVSLHYRDPLGFAERRRVTDDEVRLAVRPATIDADPAYVLAASRQFTGGGRRREGLHDPAGARPYQPGDRLARVHWPQTARTGEVQVRESWSRPALSHRIVLDTATGSYEDPAGFELAVSIAGSLALSALRRGGRVALRAGEEEIGARDAAPGRILDLLTRVNPGDFDSLRGVEDGDAIVVTGGRFLRERVAGASLVIVSEASTRRGALSLPTLEALAQLASQRRWSAQ